MLVDDIDTTVAEPLRVLVLDADDVDVIEGVFDDVLVKEGC